MANRSKVQGSTFKVKDKGGIEDPKSSFKMLIFPVIANLAPSFGLGLMKLMLFSQTRIPNAARGRNWNPWPRPGISRCGDGKPSP